MIIYFHGLRVEVDYTPKPPPSSLPLALQLDPPEGAECYIEGVTIADKKEWEAFLEDDDTYPDLQTLSLLGYIKEHYDKEIFNLAEEQWFAE